MFGPLSSKFVTRQSWPLNCYEHSDKALDLRRNGNYLVLLDLQIFVKASTLTRVCRFVPLVIALVTSVSVVTIIFTGTQTLCNEDSRLSAPILPERGMTLTT